MFLRSVGQGHEDMMCCALQYLLDYPLRSPGNTVRHYDVADQTKFG